MGLPQGPRGASAGQRSTSGSRMPATLRNRKRARRTRMHRLGWPVLIAGACLAASSPAAPANLSDGPGKLWIHRTLGAAYFDAECWGNAATELAAAAELAPESALDA